MASSTSEIEELLASWKISQEAIRIVIDMGYTSLELLKSLEPTHDNFLQLGFPTMPDQTMYRMNWNAWMNDATNKPDPVPSSKPKKKVGVLISSDESDSENRSSDKESLDESHSSATKTKTGHCNPLTNVLNQSTTGKLLLRVGSQRELRRNEQGELCNIILDHLLKDSGDQKPKLPYRIFIEWAKYVNDLFPSEPEAIWFSITPALKVEKTKLSPGAQAPASASARPHGKLYDRYGKRQAIWRDSRGLVKKKTSVTKESADSKAKKPLVEPDTEIQDNLEKNEDIITISNYQGQESSNILETAWRQTWQLRRDYMLRCSTTDYLNKFPVLRLPNIGPNLINIDFGLIHPGISSTALYTGLRNIADFIDTRASNKLRSLSKVARAQQTKIHDLVKDTEQKKVSQALLLLPFAIVGGKTGARTKASRFDAASQFIYFAKSRSEGEAHLQRLREEAAKKRSGGVQPLVVAVGEDMSNIDSTYTVIDNIWFFSPNLIEAVDLCFKAFYIFNLKYPSGCEHIWQFLQFQCYKIKNDQDKYIIDVNKCLNELKLIQEKEQETEE